MSSIQEFISKIISGDNVGARESFNVLVAEKSMEALAERKQEIAQTLFQTEAKKEKEDEDEDEDEKLDEALKYDPNSAGEFQNQNNKWYTYSPANDPWAKKHGLPHKIYVGPNAEETRFGHVKGHVAHIAVDENPDGTPKMQKWPIKNHSKHVREEVENIEESGGFKRASKQLAHALRFSQGPQDVKAQSSAVRGALNKLSYKHKNTMLRKRISNDPNMSYAREEVEQIDEISAEKAIKLAKARTRQGFGALIMGNKEKAALRARKARAALDYAKSRMPKELFKEVDDLNHES